MRCIPARRHPLGRSIGIDAGSDLVGATARAALLLADRLHGCAAFIAVVNAACDRAGSGFLIRARTNIRVPPVKRFKDGRWLVRVPVRQQGQPRAITRRLAVREIREQVRRPGHRTQTVRLWTNLPAPQSALAAALFALYARRWEHEFYDRELKRQFRPSNVLHSPAWIQECALVSCGRLVKFLAPNLHLRRLCSNIVLDACSA